MVRIGTERQDVGNSRVEVGQSHPAMKRSHSADQKMDFVMLFMPVHECTYLK